jgi:uncharacterized protein (DUF58 family)
VSSGGTDEALGRLVPAELRERLRGHALVLRRRAFGRRHGRHASLRAGVGLDFRDHRPYVPGDDPRMLDWRAVARRDRPILRQTDAEDELSVTVVLDVNGGMAYGERAQSKHAYARAMTAALLWLAQRQGDPIGLAVGVDGELDVSLARASSSRDRLGALAHRLGAIEPAGTCPWIELLDALAPRLARRSLVVVFSDLIEVGPTPEATPETEDALWRGMSQLAARGHEVVVVQILHRDEIEFPWTADRMLRFEDLRRLHDPLESPGRRLRDEYLEAFGAHLESITAACERAGIRLCRVTTDEPITAAFVRLLGQFAGAPEVFGQEATP